MRLAAPLPRGETVGMHIRGRLGEDAPDPALELIERARRMPVPVYGLIPQRHAEDWDAFGISSGSGGGELLDCAVSISYTLWRNPDYLDDPVNLAELDETQRRAVETEPPWPRPRWLLERVRRMRYPLLWECVRTGWRAEPGPHATVEAELVAHVNHLLMNGFREGRVRGEFPGELDSPVDERHVEHGIRLRVDGFERDGIRIDTDPDVYGVGVHLSNGSVLTAAIPRDALPFLTVAFARRPL